MTKPNQAHCLAKNVDGRAVRDDYLKQAAELLARHGHLRNFGIEFALFSHKAPGAAHAATQRVIAAGIQEGYFLAATDEITRRRFYALTLKGAKFVSENVGHKVKHTEKTLESLLAGPVKPDQPAPLKTMRRWKHREWSSLIVMAAEKRGMLGVAEHEAWSIYKTDLLNRYSHLPDAITFGTLPNGKRLAVFHEVETSRRSRSFGVDGNGDTVEEKIVHVPNKDPYKVYTGVRTLLNLIETLRRDEQPLTHKGKAYPLDLLVLHVQDAGIEKELRTLIEAKTNVQKVNDTDYALMRSAPHGVKPTVLYIAFNILPATPEEAWPVPGADCCLPYSNSVGTPWPAEVQTSHTRPAKASGGSHKPKLGGKRLDVIDKRLLTAMRERAEMVEHEMAKVPEAVRDDEHARWMDEVDAAARTQVKHAEMARYEAARVPAEVLDSDEQAWASELQYELDMRTLKIAGLQMD